MGIINDVKDGARKAVNAVVDGAENMIGMPKSPKELAKRLFEHLSHGEYHEVAKMLQEEVKKYVDKMGLADNPIVQDKLNSFADAVDAMANNMENRDYKQVATQFETLKNTLPDSLVQSYPMLGSIKNILTNAIDKFKKNMQDNVEPKFDDMLESLETEFDNLRK